jgi:hypothetical protein
MSKTKEEKKEEEEARRPPRPYPKHALRQALVIAEAIQEKNAGRPMRRIFVADAIGRKPSSSEFKFLLSSSYKYGLTVGTEKAEYIELTPLGRSITKPLNPEEKALSLQKAALTPDLFRKVYEHYKDAKFPQEDFLGNLLEREFGVPREWVDECAKILIDNGRFTGIIKDVSGSPYVVLGEKPIGIKPQLETAGLAPTPTEPEKPVEPKATPEEISVAPPVKRIFVAHGKNKTPLEQLKKILDQFQISHVIALEEPHIGRPISAKVAELMRGCTSAIFIFTADEEYVDSKGNKSYRPSDNVVYELGAATVLYGNKIVIFKEEGVDFASDFKDFGYISFEKDRLDAKAMDLLKELVALDFLRLVPA